MAKERDLKWAKEAAEEVKEETYFFSQPVYKKYEYCYEKEKAILFEDHCGQWYLTLFYMCENLQQLKETRQIWKPAYLKQPLQTMERLQQLDLYALQEGFDKAYGYACFYTESLERLPLNEQLKIANYDGNDDPEICHHLHYFDNRYNNETTRFIAGMETYSFATISTSTYYVEHIWRETTAVAYLLLYAYYKRYNTCPSKQMMAKFLCNLWASVEFPNKDANLSLLKIISIN